MLIVYPIIWKPWDLTDEMQTPTLTNYFEEFRFYKILCCTLPTTVWLNIELVETDYFQLLTVRKLSVFEFIEFKYVFRFKVESCQSQLKIFV